MGKSKSGSLSDRMKRYEASARQVLPERLPVIVRVDGKAFHTWTRSAKLDRPFDQGFIAWMNLVAVTLCSEIQGARLAYVQSDEISVLLINYRNLNSDSWFDNQVQKMVSVAAACASATMTYTVGRKAMFDARAFVLPIDEVTNYFLWRQNDATRNSLQMLARSMYSHAECMGKRQADLQEMCFAKGQRWDELDTELKRGRCALQVRTSLGRTSWVIDREIPIWKGDGRSYIENLLKPDAEAL